MKKLTKFFAPAIVLLSLAAGTFAQTGVTASATATAVIITPITITKTTDMNFGNIAVNALAGNVVLATNGSRTVTGGCTLPAVAGSPAAALFVVTGLATSTYSITLPSAATTISSGSNTMTVDTWVSNPTPTGTLTGGT